MEDCVQLAFEKINRSILIQMGSTDTGTEDDGPPPANLDLFKRDHGFRPFAWLIAKDVTRTENRRTLRNRHDELPPADQMAGAAPEEQDVADLLHLFEALLPAERLIVSSALGIPAHGVLNRQGLLQLLNDLRIDDEPMMERVRRCGRAIPQDRHYGYIHNDDPAAFLWKLKRRSRSTSKRP